MLLMVFLAFAAPPLSAQAVSTQSASSMNTADLSQCYAWAKKQSESLRIQEEQVYQLEQQYKQILGSALPNLSYSFTEKYQDTSGASSTSNPGPFFQSPQPQANFILSQPLFTGFREFAGMSSLKHQGKAGELQLQHAYVSLFRDVANAFYLIINLETQLANVQSAIDLSTNRIKELREWVNLGKSRHSEVVLVESQEASYEAQAEFLKGQIDAARDMLSFLTGQDMGHVELMDRMDRVRSLDPEDRVLSRAERRTDVRSQRELVESQEAMLRVAKGAWYPIVGVVGDYYNKRQSFLSPIHWDATLSLSLPIFSGGSSLAGVRLAESQVSQAKYNLSLTLRQAHSDIHSAYVTLRASLAQSAAAERSYNKADESYRLQLREYRLGLVSNLDVLQAMNSRLSAKLISDQAIVQSKLNLLGLKVADEEMP